MAVLHIKKNDMVVVISGEEKGKAGKVLAAYPQKGRVLVEGINIVHKALRKSQENPKGGIVTREAPLPVSKVMLQVEFEARKKKRGGAPAAQPQA
ncbi:MAG: 50S ribosomal protein L24 [Verrucomicrobia bacterium]|nr:50S ribosomal protein L24 [Verrucomicrobiota bacterium]